MIQKIDTISSDGVGDGSPILSISFSIYLKTNPVDLLYTFKILSLLYASARIGYTSRTYLCDLRCRFASGRRSGNMRLFSVLLLSFVSARGYGKVKNEERKVLRATFFILHFSLFTLHCSFFTFLSLLNQLLCVRLSVFDNAHKVQSCRQPGHRDLERRLIRPERAQHPHTAPDLDFVSASVGREHA